MDGSINKLNMSNVKISIRFFDNREWCAVWDEQNAKWWFSVLDGSKKNDSKKVQNGIT